MSFYTYTGRELLEDEMPWFPTSVADLSVRWKPKGGRDVQAARMFAKARRRASRLIPWDRPVRFKLGRGSFIFRRGQAFVRAGDIEEVGRDR